MANHDFKFKVSGNGTLTNYHFAAAGPVRAGEGTEPNDEAKKHEAHGEIVGGEETYLCNGAPVGFYTDDPANAWSLDLSLDFGAGWVRFVPTHLNAATVDVRSEGAHYLLSVPEPGMILRGEKADKPDQILTPANTVAAGNVRGGQDSYRIWPPMCGFDAIADHPAEIRVRGAKREWSGWKSIPVVRPEMGF